MDSNLLTTILMIAVMFAAFYLLIIRPQRKRQAQQRETIESLTPGARVLTSTGIYATLVRLGDKQAVIELAPGHEMTVVKHAIVRVVQPGDEDLEMDSRVPDDLDDEQDHRDDPDLGNEQFDSGGFDPGQPTDDSSPDSDDTDDSDATDKREGDDSPWADRDGNRGSGA